MGPHPVERGAQPFPWPRGHVPQPELSDRSVGRRASRPDGHYCPVPVWTQAARNIPVFPQRFLKMFLSYCNGEKAILIYSYSAC